MLWRHVSRTAALTASTLGFAAGCAHDWAAWSPSGTSGAGGTSTSASTSSGEGGSGTPPAGSGGAAMAGGTGGSVGAGGQGGSECVPQCNGAPCVDDGCGSPCPCTSGGTCSNSGECCPPTWAVTLPKSGYRLALDSSSQALYVADDSGSVRRLRTCDGASSPATAASAGSGFATRVLEKVGGEL